MSSTMRRNRTRWSSGSQSGCPKDLAMGQLVHPDGLTLIAGETNGGHGDAGNAIVVRVVAVPAALALRTTERTSHWLPTARTPTVITRFPEARSAGREVWRANIPRVKGGDDTRYPCVHFDG